MSGSGSKQRVRLPPIKRPSPAAHASSAKQTHGQPSDSVGYIRFLQRTAGNAAVSEYLRSTPSPTSVAPLSVQRKGPLDWLLGKGKKQDAPLVLSGPSGGRAG